ncbi:MAG: DUF1330 domain-containing protein [Rhizobiales bacterium]|nr:DUF1330 domain-containing protein [Hyphomicrobiales bacterium]
MAKGYWIARVDVSDPEAYKQYIGANAEPFARFGARFIVRGGQYDPVEGVARARNIVIEFPSMEAARACWHDEAYQRAKALRTATSVAEIIVIEGYDGPQPGESVPPR